VYITNIYGTWIITYSTDTNIGRPKIIRSIGVPPISPLQRDVTSESLFRASTIYVNLNRRLEGIEIVIPTLLGVLDSQSERHGCLICERNVEGQVSD
jgi:hypothetical protein